MLLLWFAFEMYERISRRNPGDFRFAVLVLRDWTVDQSAQLLPPLTNRLAGLPYRALFRLHPAPDIVQIAHFRAS
jgi:hypothetical protein